MILTAQYNGNTIEFEVIFRNRKTITIQLSPEGRIIVLSPSNLSESYLIKTVSSKGRWILNKTKKLKEVGNFINVSKTFINGEFFLFFGRNYSLRIIKNENLKKPAAYIADSNLIIETKKTDKDSIKKYLYKWYRVQSDNYVLERFEFLKNRFDVLPKMIKVKEQKRRWGSCTFSGNIYLNWRLIMAPVEVIDYVIIHEMSHLLIHDHSARFWKLVEKYMPDYKKRKKYLRDEGLKMSF